MKSAFLLSYDASGWTIACAEQQRVVTQAEGAEPMIRQALQELGWRRGPACLGLPSSMVYSALIECDNLPRKGRRSAMEYRLEEQLPLDAEALTADFLPSSGAKCLGLAVQSAKVRALLDPLTQAGIAVGAIVPTAVLAAWAGMSGGPVTNYVLVALNGQTEVFRLHEGAIQAWYTVGDNAGELARCLEADQLANPIDGLVTATVVGSLAALGGESAQCVLYEANLHVVQQLGPWAVQSAAGMADKAISGAGEEFVNFRRDTLAPKSPWGQQGQLVRMAVGLAVLLVAVITAGLWWRTWQYQDKAQEARTGQRLVYEKLHPSTPVPAMVRRRLEAEQQRLLGVKGQGQEVPQQVSALNTLQRVARALPVGVRYNLQEITIAPETISMEGQSRELGESDAINQSLQIAGFEMDPARTERLASSVGFTLSGKVRPPKGPPAGTTPQTQPEVGPAGPPPVLPAAMPAGTPATAPAVAPGAATRPATDAELDAADNVDTQPSGDQDGDKDDQPAEEP